MRAKTHTIIRILTVILLLTGLSGRGNMSYAWSGSGDSSDPYTISSKTDWEFFVNNISSTSSYVHFEGKYIKLTADISVGNVMTPDSYSFRGTFDGNGHTIKIDVNSYGKYLALFRFTYGATIKNLRVVGSIKNGATGSNADGANKYSAGLVGDCRYGTTIKNCVISVTISSSIDGDGSHGGIVGRLYETDNTGCQVKIENCLFNGKLLGDKTHSCGGFVGAGYNNSQKCEIRNCLFSPSEITMISDGRSSTFSRCSNNTFSYNYYTKALGTTQGGDVSETMASNIPSLLNTSNSGVDGNSNPWVLNEGGNIAYLKTFNTPVDITGWIAGSTAGTSSTNPYLDIFGGVGVTYEYKKDGFLDEYYTTTAPTTAGHYVVRATTSDGFKNIKDFYVYAPPTPITSLTYNGNEQNLLTVPNIANGYYMFKVNQDDWGPSTPKKRPANTYTIYYFVKSSEYGYNDVGSRELPAGIIEVTIAPKSLDSGAIVLGETTYTYDGTEKKPSVTVKDGSTTVSSDAYTVSYSSNTNAGTATVTVTDKEGGNYVVNGTATFTINRKTLASDDITIKLNPESVEFNYEEQKPEVILYDGNADDGKIIPSSEYSVTYYKNVKVGTATAVVTDSDADGGNYILAEKSATFTIIARTVDNPKITVSPLTFTYDGTEKEPDVTVKDGDTLIPSTEYTVTYSNNVNVGTNATVTITDNEGGSYTVSGTATFSIVANGSTYIPPTARSGLTYTGEAQELITSGSTTTGTMHYYSLDDENYSTNIPKGTDAKTYTVYYKVVGDANHYDSPASKLTVTISPKTVDAPTITVSPSSYTYDGKAKEPSVTVKDEETVIPSTEYTVTYSNNTNVGTAKVMITDKDGGNYIVNGKATFSIVSEGTTYTAPTAKTDLSFTGSAQELITAGSATSGLMVYSLDGETYSTNIPRGRDAKDYAVYYKVVDSNGNDIISAMQLTATIHVKTVDNPTITVTPSSYTYDGTAKRPSVTVKDGETEIASSEYSVIYSNNTNVGTAKVSIIDKDGGNYDVSGTATFTIVSGSSTYTAPTAKTGLTYNGSAQELISSGSTTTGTMKYSLDDKSYSTTIPTGTNAQTYTVYYKVVGDDNHDDSAVSQLTATISAKDVDDPTITVSPSSYTYDGTAKKPSVTVKDGETVISSSEYTVSYYNNTNVGTAYVNVTDNDGGNYTVSGKATFSIESDGSTFIAPTAKKDLTYNGSAQELITSGSALTGTTIKYSLDGESYSTKIPKGTDAKSYTVYYKVVDSDGNDIISAMQLTATIHAKTVDEPTITVSPSSYVYDGKAKKPAVTVKDGETEISSTEYTVTYSNNTEVGTAKVRITDNDGGNYDVSGMATFSIVSESTTFTAPTAKTDLTYNGSAQELVTAGSATTGTLKYSLDDQSYSATIPTGTDAKTYTVYYKVVGSDNSDLTSTYSLTVTISQKTVSISVSLSDAGPNRMPAITVTDSDGDRLTTADYTYEVKDADGNEVDASGRMEAGDYMVKVKPTGNCTGNSVMVSFHVRGAYSFVFTMESDIIGVCLPYNRDVPEGYHLYVFDRVDTDDDPVFKYSQDGTMTAGEPYLLRYVDESSGTRGTHTVDLSPSNLGLIDVSISIQSQTKGNMIFTGTFYEMTVGQALTEGAYLLRANRTWKLEDSNSDDNEVCLEAFMAYICYKNHSTIHDSLNTSLVNSNGDQEDLDPPSAIHSVILEDENGNQAWYDFNGRRIETPQKGVNILRMDNGKTKKVIRK